MNKHPRVAVATSSSLAAEAAAEIAAAGGNAVDCAVAASMIAMNTQPGVCSLAGGAYVTVWRDGDDPVTIDGGVAVPGIDAASATDGGVPLSMAYGGGVDTIVGCASVGVPGSLAACERASARYGSVPWRLLFEPGIRAAREGFPLPEACHYYLEYSGRPIFCRSDDGERALYADGELRPTGATIRVPHLADSLEEIARDGAASFYRGRLAGLIVDHVQSGGGALTRADLERYEPTERAALQVDLDDWQVALNPPPAVGGAVLASLLTLCRHASRGNAMGEAEFVRHLADAQAAALAWRRNHLDLSDDVPADAARLLELAASGQLLHLGMSSATVHTSAVDDRGLACAITSSAGYGSGEMPQGTGLWLNNCLGELELNRRGLSAGPAGARLPSNMAPGVARAPQRLLAFGSPGADRITTALQQVLLRHLVNGDELKAAVDAPRLHVETGGDELRIAAEAGIERGRLDAPIVDYPRHSMYFGGVGIASCVADQLTAAADPRRAGGVFVSS